MTVAVVTVAVGDTYRAFLTEWAHAVADLETPPDEVVIVTDRITNGVLEAVDITGGTAIASTTTWRHHPQILANEAIRETSTDWVCKMDVDDIIYPHALNPIPDTVEDVLCFGITYCGLTLIPPATTANQILAATGNLLFAGSPFRRSVFDQTAGFRDMVYDDWAFWRETARAGATYQPTRTADYDYRMHGANASTRINRQDETRKALAV